MPTAKKERMYSEDDFSALYHKWMDQYCKDAFKRKLNADLVVDYVAFIVRYFGFMMIDGLHEQNYKRIRKFLAIQRLDQLKGTTILKFIAFQSSEQIEYPVYVKSLQGIDIDDVRSIIQFDIIHVQLPNNEIWNKDTARKFVDEIQEDLESDGEYCPLEYRLVSKHDIVITFTGEEA